MKVDLFIPCFIDQFFPHVGFASIELLKRFGCQVNYNPKQTCCGQPAYNSGFHNEAKKIAEYFIQVFNGENYIVTPSGSCASMVKIFYKDLIDEEKFIMFQERTFEIIDFIYSILGIKRIDSNFSSRVALHQPCHLKRELNTLDSTIKILKSINNLELLTFENADECCGFGGTFSIKFDKISIDMGKDKLKNISKVKADFIISNDASCMMHLEGISRAAKFELKFMHTAEFLNKILKNELRKD